MYMKFHCTQTGHKCTIAFFYILLTVYPNIMIVFFHQLDAQILYFNTFVTLLYMFRAQQCSKHVQECNKCIKIKNLCIKLLKKKKTISTIAWKLFVSWQLQRWWQNISVQLHLTVWDSEVLTAVLLKVPALWHVTPRQLVYSVLFISLDKFMVNRMPTQNRVLSKKWNAATITNTITTTINSNNNNNNNNNLQHIYNSKH